MSENYQIEIFVDKYKPLIMERLRYSGTPNADFKKRMEDTVRFFYKHRIMADSFHPSPELVALAYIFAKRFQARSLYDRGIISRDFYYDNVTKDIHDGVHESASWLVVRGWWRPIHSFGRRQLYFSIKKVENGLLSYCAKYYGHLQEGH